jgi:CDP-diacylglycerol--glycerol-3-phosphate 3-phosphatidyltransferase
MGIVLPLFLTSPLLFGKSIGLLVFILAALTDYWDGWLARARGQSTVFGQRLDPLADKVLICSAFICFVALDQVVPAWIVVIIIAREFMVTGLRLLAASQGKVMPAGRWGKHKTVWQILVIVAILAGLALRQDVLPLVFNGAALNAFLAQTFDPLFQRVTVGLAGLAALLTVVSGSVYFWHSRELVWHHAS